MTRRTSLAVGVALWAGLAAVLTACAADTPLAVTVDTKPDPEPGVPSRERVGFIRANESCDASTPYPTPDAAFSPPPDDVGFVAVPVLEGLDDPTVIEFLDDEVAFIGLRDGVVLRWAVASGATETVIDLTAITGTSNDQGLTGLAVTPDRRYLLVHHTTVDESRLVAYPLDDGFPDIAGSFVVLIVRQPSTQHNGGSIEFDADGNLWASFGDGGGQGDRFGNAQDPTTPLGAILRMTVELDDGPIIAGADGNPYLDGVHGHPWVFATGIRNPFRFSIDPVTAEVWIGDVGQACMEEVSVIDPATDAGANLGWNVFEGTRPFLGELAGEHHAPVLAYGRDGGFCVVVGGHVYRGDAIAELAGAYVFSDWCRGEVLVFDRAAGVAVRTGVELGMPVDIEPDPDGELLVASMTGEILRLVPR